MILDSHVHFWNYDNANPEFDWIGEGMEKIKKSFLPEDLIHATNIKNYCCIAVQAAETWQETEFLLELAEKNDFIKGVVGWCDVQNFEPSFIAHNSSLLKGFRHIIQAKPHGYMSSDSFRYFISKLKNHNYTYDLLLKPHQLEEAQDLVSDFPNQKFVIDHVAKPDFRTYNLEQWKSSIQEFKHLPNVYCKISGMVTEANWQSWEYSDFTYALDVVFETFGTSRLMYGSDWPVCLLAADYNQVTNIVAKFISILTSTEHEDIFYKNAMKFYNIHN